MMEPQPIALTTWPHPPCLIIIQLIIILFYFYVYSCIRNLMNNVYFKVLINGEPFNCESSMSIQDVLVYLNIDVYKVIVEYNTRVINYLQFEQILVQEGDTLEIITIVGGG
uniref:thiamine biosynthesis protein S n=1 Tax=Campylaephora boydenii TaxID=202204 RepID=UPI002551FA6D|nr:thiamine biosynthesis protein S [Campylaephora boydenii]WGT74169.1 thiamine biosynthesis protein S [Campylaephora boydenii]